MLQSSIRLNIKGKQNNQHSLQDTPTPKHTVNALQTFGSKK